VNAAVEQLANCYDCHEQFSFFGARRRHSVDCFERLL
jgi:nicotinic acid phosphoribosyltransferase